MEVTTTQKRRQQQQQQQHPPQQQHQHNKQHNKQQHIVLQARLLSSEPCTPSNPWLVDMLLLLSTSSKKKTNIKVGQQQQPSTTAPTASTTAAAIAMAISKLTREQANTFFTTLHQLVMDYPIVNDDDDDDEHQQYHSDDNNNDNDPEEFCDSRKQFFGIQVLHAAAVAIQAHLDGLLQQRQAKKPNSNKNNYSGTKNKKQRPPPPPSLALLDQIIDLAIVLHDQLFHLQLVQQQTTNVLERTVDSTNRNTHDHSSSFSSSSLFTSTTNHNVTVGAAAAAKQAQDAILHLCETCWHANVVHREQLTVQVIPILLTLSLSSSPSALTKTTTTSTMVPSGKQLLQRLWQLRHALDNFDFQHDSSRYFRSILLKTVSHPLWLKLPHGRQFLAFVLSSSSPPPSSSWRGGELDSYQHHRGRCYGDAGNDDDADDRNNIHPVSSGAQDNNNNNHLNDDHDDEGPLVASIQQELHEAMRMQIPNANPTILQAYADIYYRAWNESSTNVHQDDDDDDDISNMDHTVEDNVDDDDDGISTLGQNTSARQWLEQHVLQDLVYSMIHVQSSAMHQALQSVLEPFFSFHNNNDNQPKKPPTPAMTALWYRLCSPILWRALSSIHPQVQCQAMNVLAQVFPLVPPPPTLKQRAKSAMVTNVKSAMDKALRTMTDMMLEDHPTVRVATSQAVAHVLSNFWNVIPTPSIRSLLNHLVMKHVSDGSSAVVRAGAVQAMTTLIVQAPESHAALRTLLPHVGNLIHDRAAKVRLACVHMLLALQKLQQQQVCSAAAIKFYHVVPVHHLTARLAMEPRKSPTALALTLLLLPSYLPSTGGGANQVQRTLVFLSTDGDANATITTTTASSDASAAMAFYAHVSQHVPVSTVTKLIVMLWKCLVTAVETAGSEQPSNGSSNHNKLAIKPNSANTQQRGERMNEDDHTDSDDDDSDEPAQGTVDREPRDAESMDRTGPLSVANNQNENRKKTLLTVHNRPLMANMAETIDTLWSSIQDVVLKSQHQLCHEFLMQSFSGSSMTTVIQCFDTMATAGLEDDTNNNYIIHGYRVCAALLKCAGRLTANIVPCLARCLMSRLVELSNIMVANGKHIFGQSCNHVGDYLTAIIALLCAWGYTDQVGQCLSSSLLSALHHDGENATPMMDDDIQSSPFHPASKKRGRVQHRPVHNNNIDNGHPECSDDVGDSIIVSLPTIGAPAAMYVLDNILRGANDSIAATRELLLNSPSATTALEQALKHSIQSAERLIKANVDLGSNTSDSNIELIVMACDAYGRFQVHKQATLEKGRGVKLSLQAHHLLEWTTERLVPALKWSSARLLESTPLKEGEVTPFPDLDLSRISTASSFATTTNTRRNSFFSLSPQPPPRQRANRNCTPQKLLTDDASFEFPGDNVGRQTRTSGAFLTLSSLVTANAVAAALFLSFSTLFSEWVELASDENQNSTGISQEVEAIKSFVVKWFNELLIQEPSFDSVASVVPEVWIGLCKLAAQLAKVAKEFQPFEILLKAQRQHQHGIGSDAEQKEQGGTSQILQDSILSVLAGRNGDAAVTAGLVNCVVHVAQSLFDVGAATKEDHHDAEIDDGRKVSMSDVWNCETGGGCYIPDALMVLSSNANACMLLAERLMMSLFHNNDGPNENEAAAADSSTWQQQQQEQHARLFAAKCILWLCHDQSTARCSASTKKKMKSKLRKRNNTDTTIWQGMDPQLGNRFESLWDGDN